MSVETTSGDRSSAEANAGTPSRKPPRRRRIWRRLALFAIGLLAIGVLAVVATLATLPDDIVRKQVSAIVEDATGRELRIDGAARVALRPNLALELNNIVLAGAQGAAGPPLLSADKVEVEIQLIPLLRGRIDVSLAKVVKPAITVAPDDAELTQRGGKAIATVAALSIDDGAINVAVDGPNPALRIDKLSAELKGLSADGLQNGSGTFRWRGEPVRFEMSVVPATDGGSQSFAVDAKFGGNHGATEFAGTLDPAGMSVTGNIDATTPSLRKLLAWFDVKTGPRALAGEAALKGPIVASASGLKLEGADIKVPGGDGKLTVAVSLAGARPAVAGRIDWSDLQVDTLLGAAAPSAAGVVARVKVAEQVAEIETGWRALGEFLTAVEQGQGAASVAPQSLTAAARPEGWNAQPIDLTALTRVDLDLAQTAEKLTYRGLTLEKVKSDVKLTDGQLALAVDELVAGKGTANGRLSVDSRADPPQLALEAKTQNAPLETLISEVFGTRIVSGSTGLLVKLTGRGRSERDIVSSLGGRASVTIENGEIIGYDLRRALIEWWRKWSYDPKRRTKFAKLAADLTVTKGVMQSASDLSLTGPDVDITSRGSIGLPSRSVEQSLRMKLAPPPQHLPVPLKVSGPWTKPSIGWDLFSVAAAPRDLAAPQNVFAAPEGTPPEIATSIRRILADRAKADSLTPEMRTLLQSLMRQ